MAQDAEDAGNSNVTIETPKVRQTGVPAIDQVGAVAAPNVARTSSDAVAQGGKRAETNPNLTLDERGQVREVIGEIANGPPRPQEGTQSLLQITKADAKLSPGSRGADNVPSVF